MIEQTWHGQNIAGQINGFDAYGVSGTLTPADVWLFLDTLETHFTETAQPQIEALIGPWKRQVEALGAKLDPEGIETV